MPAISEKLVRFASVLAGGAAATFVLFYIMQALIRSDGAIPRPGDLTLIETPVMPEFEFEPRKEHPKPQKLELPEQPPEIPEPTISGPRSGPDIFTVTPPRLAETTLDTNFVGVPDTNAIALVQVQATYPQRALQREIEGHVIVEFDVNEEGMVQNPRVLEAVPEGWFETAALRALERYRYQPKIVDGSAVKMYGIQQKISFNLAD